MSPTEPETPDTLPKLLLAQAARWGARRTAIREKEFGIWQAHSWQDDAGHVERIVLGLAALGFRRGDNIARYLADLLHGTPVPGEHEGSETWFVPAPSTGWRGLDLNQRPLGYEPLPNRDWSQRATNNTS